MSLSEFDLVRVRIRVECFCVPGTVDSIYHALPPWKRPIGKTNCPVAGGCVENLKSSMEFMGVWAGIQVTVDGYAM